MLIIENWKIEKSTKKEIKNMLIALLTTSLFS